MIATYGNNYEYHLGDLVYTTGCALVLLKIHLKSLGRPRLGVHYASQDLPTYLKVGTEVDEIIPR